MDGVYWANTTMLTIGLGDYSPITHLGQSLLLPYAIGGVVMLGLVIGSIRSLILERGKQKLGARMVEKERERVVGKLDNKGGKLRLSPLSTQELQSGESEKDRREAEFNLMRKIQAQTSARRRWTSLLTSTLAWLSLWLIGAVVFWEAEKGPQSWTYFEAIYFSYTSLITIGYGDFTPVSNSAKAFFVFWSLLAIPTLTILISNMGDTIIKVIRDATLWLGEITVLPEKDRTLALLKHGAQKITKGKFLEDDAPTEDQPGGIVGLSEENRDPEKGNKRSKRNHAGGLAGADALGEELEQEELDDAKLARRRGDRLDENTHLYHYLLVREMRKVMKDFQKTPDKNYTFEEWSWFLHLMGEDEGNPKHHGEAQGKHEVSQKEFINDQENRVQNDESGSEEEKNWSWIGIRSPLMGETDEPEWILGRLSLTLERQLKKGKDRQRKEQQQQQQQRSNRQQNQQRAVS